MKLIEQPANGKNKATITVTKFQNTKSDKSAKPTSTPPPTRAASTKPSTAPAPVKPAQVPSRPAAKTVGDLVSRHLSVPVSCSTGHQGGTGTSEGGAGHSTRPARETRERRSLMRDLTE